jgi:hypothetical protein
MLVLLAISQTWCWFAAVGLTLFAGVLLDRWWAALVPFGAFAVVLLIAFAKDPHCHECGEDPWSLQLVYALFVACPTAALMAAGVGVRRLARQARRRSPPPEPRVP